MFSYSGQSIPNRLDVKKAKGVKIYFDAVETAARVEQVKLTVGKIFANAHEAVLDKFRPEAVEQLVWHVAAHEVSGLGANRSAAPLALLQSPLFPYATERLRVELNDAESTPTIDRLVTRSMASSQWKIL